MITNVIMTRLKIIPAVVLLILIISGVVKSQESWKQRADFGGTSRSGAVGFSIGNKGYIGTGWDGSNYLKDFWEYDPKNNTWTQCADFGGTSRYRAVGFSIIHKGYIGTGWDESGVKKDFWEYDPATNAWTQRADFGGTGRAEAVGFSIGDIGYVGLGTYWDGTRYRLKDFWEYDHGTNTWTQRADFGGIERGNAVGFSIGHKGYIGTGWDETGVKKDFWEYDHGTNTWTQRADFGGTERWDAVGFSIESKGYLGTGSLRKDFWEYDPKMNTWTQSADFGGVGRWGAVGFSIGDKGYVGTGWDFSISLKDFWEFDPTIPYLVVNTDTMSFGGIGVGNISVPQNFILTGGNLTSDIKINAPPGFEISLDKDDGYQNNLLFSSEDRYLSVKIYVRFSPKENIFYENNIENSIIGGKTINISVTGTGIDTYTTGEWIQRADFGGTARHEAVGFSIGDKGYIGTGWDGSLTKDFWEYDPKMNTWTQRANFGGDERFGAVGFSIGDKGYIGLGWAQPTDYFTDFWEYDPSANVWTRRADFNGKGRYVPVGFSIDNKGYVGTGGYHDGNYRYFRNDFWEYDPLTDVWKQLADFGGEKRWAAIGFSIGDKGYIGMGFGEGGAMRDFWEYQPTTNSWIQRANFGGTARQYAVGFSIDDKGYVGTGHDGSRRKDFWEYDSVKDSWTELTDFGGTERAGAVGFSIGYRGYIGTGINGSRKKDFWEYSPYPATIVIPPRLVVADPVFTDTDGDNCLSAQERALINFTITNEGEGTARDVRIQGKTVSKITGLSANVGDIEPDSLRTVSLTIVGDRELKDGYADIEFSITEASGFDAPPIRVRIPTRAYRPPQLVIHDVGVNDDAGRGIITPGEVIELTVRVLNSGGGVAENVHFIVEAGDNVFIEGRERGHYSQQIGTIEPGGYRDVTFQAFCNTRADKFRLYVSLAENQGMYGIDEHELALELHRPQRTYRELIVEGREIYRETGDIPTLSISIERDIPQAEQQNPDAVAVIIGNRTYRGDTPDVAFALHDASLTRRYVEQALGYRPGNILYLENATLTDMRVIFGDDRSPQGRLSDLVKEGQSDVFVYYSGHGAPDPNTKAGYLMPVDADPNRLSLTGYPLEWLYENLSKLGGRSVTVVIDACFSGATGAGDMLIAQASPIGIEIRDPAARIPNGTIITASTGSQTASWYPEKRHGLLTYFFLKGIQGAADFDNDGRITVGELRRYMSDRVNGLPYYARRLHGREQTPQVWGEEGKVLR